MITFYTYPTKEQEVKLKVFLKALDIPFTKYDGELPLQIVESMAKDQEDTASDIL